LKKCRDGFLTVDKPRGVTSFSVVAAVRHRFGEVKTGHAGTLDPAASGLLVLALGQATRLLPFVPLEPKIYRFGVRFGVETDTLDKEGKVLRSGGSIPSVASLEAVLPGFCGVLSQVPPQFSAVRKDGVHAYSLARQGRSVELAPRRITVFSLLLLLYDPAVGEALLEVSCSSGTYVRSLARDIAASLGTCGHASSIRRLATGNFHVDRALAFDKLDKADDAVIPVHEVLQGLARVTVDAAQEKQLAVGNAIVCERIPVKEGNTVFAFDNGNNLTAVLNKEENGRYHPIRVFLKG
jgi:tRNA pseudouridine55 synthase